MRLVTSLEELLDLRRQLPEPLGLVPTMGYLHEGHLSLARRARSECASVAVSIFVNPTQFGPGEDLQKYPRDLRRDLALLDPVGVDVVWAPSPEAVYPPRFQTYVTVEEVTRPLEGRARPHHFQGVATVVCKLFLIFQPQRAYFGQKDAQQVVVVRRMVQDLNFPLRVMACPTVREQDGLAMSSRNQYLSADERRAAGVLFRALTRAQQAYQAGQREADLLRAEISKTLQAEPLATEEYVSVAQPETLEELLTVEQDGLFSLAVRLGQTRLIDNFLLERGAWSTGVIFPDSKGQGEGIPHDG
ncbi:MAG: pantoate--beta-alanine ligase [Anaerolineales bacterium]|jgi:pantoate--beta-alanine ligase